MRLRRATVELDELVDGAVEVVGVESVERLRCDRSDCEDLLREPHEERAVAGLCECVRDREVGDGGREEHRAVGLLRPQVAEDVAGALRVRQVADESGDPLALAAVELADVERTLAADEDAARREIVGPEVHEGADGPFLADPARDHGLVDAVLEGDDEAVRCKTRLDRVERGAGVLALHREQYGAEPVRQLAGRDGRHANGELLDRPFDREPALVDGRDVLGIGVAQQHVVPVAREPRADRPTDRSGSHDDVLHRARLIGIGSRGRRWRSAPASSTRMTCPSTAGEGARRLGGHTPRVRWENDAEARSRSSSTTGRAPSAVARRRVVRAPESTSRTRSLPRSPPRRRSGSADRREEFGPLRVLVGMKLRLLLTTVALGVLVLALSGWLVQGLRSTPRLLVAG